MRKLTKAVTGQKIWMEQNLHIVQKNLRKRKKQHGF